MPNIGIDFKRLLMNRKAIFLFVFIVAAAVRAATFVFYSESPLAYYSQIKSLDMMLILTQGCNLASGSGIFTFHRALVAFATLFADGGASLATAVVVVQLALGSFISVMLASSAINLTGSRVAALAAGLIGAVYTHEIFYEVFTLKESSTVFAAVFCFWAMTNALVSMKNASSWKVKTAIFIAGFAAALLPLARFMTIMWTFCAVAFIAVKIMSLKKPAKFKAVSFAMLFSGMAMLWIPAAVWNTWQTGAPAIFDVNMAYNLKAGTHKYVTSYNVDVSRQEQSGKLELLKKAASHAPYKFSVLLSSYQPADNVNYYFIKGIFPIFEFLPGKMILVPLGLCGFIVILANLPFDRRISALAPAVFFACIAIPIAMFVPNDRYALALFPAYALSGAFLIKWVADGVRSQNPVKRMSFPLAGIFMFAGVMVWSLPTDIPPRASDYTAYAVAVQSKYGIVKAVGDAYFEAWRIDPSVSSTVNLGKFLIDTNNIDAAIGLMAPVVASGNVSPNLLVNFSVALMMKGDFAQAESILERGLVVYPEGEDGKLSRTLRAVRDQKDAAKPK